MIYPLKNTLQHYAWGSKTAMTELFGFANPNNQPQAELWMGAHPSACSLLLTDDGEKRLDDFIAENPEAVLGKAVYQRFGCLPYLLKILSAGEPLSIQVHPNKVNAEKGFARENAQGIPLDAPHRNYKDDNHKPELVYALTEYDALNGFREISEIIALFDTAAVPTLDSVLSAFKLQPDNMGLQTFFAAVMSLSDEEKSQAVRELLNTVKQTDKATDKMTDATTKIAFRLIADCAKLYPGDVGLFAPLLLNIITLQPGEAMFLYAETPHAYLHGTGIEIMASSDNVLRAGLTPKYMDAPELIANVNCQPMPLDTLKLASCSDGYDKFFPIPVDDFAFEVCFVEGESDKAVNSAEIILCLNGAITLIQGKKTLMLQRGESVFITADSRQYTLRGQGEAVRAYVNLSK